ncbi:uncharacterized protein LOC6541477 [Drosophila erecta]|uniref:Uncharacterized protein n=1 Tax=Drosophila erecta TaxID=7220 RepID=B3N3V5_DROER|nr:uncharacterized protein LOC6541477 [Drosophila erecta]EDV58807.1 uncharacterized protein Dere_GG23779 [Drosophila erecta]
MAFIVLATILVLSQGIQCQDSISSAPLKKLNAVVTSRLKERLKEASAADFAGHYERLQQAADLPIFQLDEKIMAYNELNHLQRTDASSGSTSEPAVRNETDGAVLRQNMEFTMFERRILRLLRRLGIYDRFTARVFNAIFSDEMQLRKLKKKLDELGKEDKDKDNDKDVLWGHVFELF